MFCVITSLKYIKNERWQKHMKNENIKFEEQLKELGLEYTVTTSQTMLEEMGASIGWNSCSSVLPAT